MTCKEPYQNVDGIGQGYHLSMINPFSGKSGRKTPYLLISIPTIEAKSWRAPVMAAFGVLEILLALVCFIILLRLRGNTNALPTDWPLVRMLPALLWQVPRIHDWLTGLMQEANSNFLLRGPWFCNMDMLLTSDPANIHHIMSANFVNFPKGSEFQRMFDVLGDGIFNADNELWKDQRRVAVSLVNHRNFHQFLARTSRDKIQNGLFPILDHASREGLVVDLQDLFQRFTFDSICKLVTGFDSGCLSAELPEVPFAKALDDVEEAIFFRHVLPEFLWKLQRWLGVGQERKLSQSWKSLDSIIAKYIETKREDIREGGISRSDEEGSDLLTSYMSLNKDEMLCLDCNKDKFLRDTILSFMLAGRDTTSSALTWFFWNLSKHPSVEAKIREEISSLATEGEEMFESKEFINKLVYLHGAICESLRLYPPLPLEHKSPIKTDMLPSGHHLRAHNRILICLYAMARMPSIWGKDCAEFRPERWITDKGTIKHEPSYKFMAFNAGPRTCLGKEVAFTQLKTVAVAVIRNFDVQIVEGQDVRACASIILHMKNGLKARVTKRSGC